MNEFQVGDIVMLREFPMQWIYLGKTHAFIRAHYIPGTREQLGHYTKRTNPFIEYSRLVDPVKIMEINEHGRYRRPCTVELKDLRRVDNESINNS